MDRHASAESFRAEDFRVRVQPLTAAPEDSTRRDPFRPKSAALAAKADVPVPPPKTPQQLEEEAARAELAQIKLAGVVFRGERREAFIVKGGETLVVHAGEKIGGRFTVEAIAADSVRVKDPATGVTGQIPISGN
jgi:Tfp pilus assembly protein PilP